MATVTELKNSMASKKLYEEMEHDQELEEMFAEKAGLMIEKNIDPDEDGVGHNEYTGSKTQWEIFNRLDSGELQICRKCGEVVKGEARETTICSNCAF